MREIKLPPLRLPPNFNYVGVFLTFSCQLRCTYCINHHGGDLVKQRRMNADDWIQGLNRITTRDDLPLTLQGGEPSAYKDYLQVIAGIKPETPIDMLTNLELNPNQLNEFMRRIPPGRLRRDSKYASIRVSYHHGQSEWGPLLQRVLTLKTHGYSVGIWEVDHPSYHSEVIYRQQEATSLGVDYRLKEFLGPHKGVNHGTFRYEEAVNARELRTCSCRTSELLIGPGGGIFRCHSDLYANRTPIGHILDSGMGLERLGQWNERLGQWRLCKVMGKCNSCDLKVKTNRFQEYGHSSVDIEHVSAPTGVNTAYVEEVDNTYGRR